MDDSLKPLAVLIAVARESKGWNQSDLARAIGVSPQAVQKWESGAAAPRMAKMVAIASALGIQDHQALANAYGFPLTADRSGSPAKNSAAAENQDEPSGLSADEKRVLRIFRSLHPALRDTAIRQMKALSALGPAASATKKQS